MEIASGVMQQKAANPKSSPVPNARNKRIWIVAISLAVTNARAYMIAVTRTSPEPVATACWTHPKKNATKAYPVSNTAKNVNASRDLCRTVSVGASAIPRF